MIYVLTRDRCADLPVAACCRTMKVSRSAFHAWRYAQANPTARMLADAVLGDLVVKIHESRHESRGASRLRLEVRAMGPELQAVSMASSPQSAAKASNNNITAGVAHRVQITERKELLPAIAYDRRAQFICEGESDEHQDT
jgi:hypothetical protein